MYSRALSSEVTGESKKVPSSQLERGSFAAGRGMQGVPPRNHTENGQRSFNGKGDTFVSKRGKRIAQWAEKKEGIALAGIAFLERLNSGGTSSPGSEKRDFVRGEGERSTGLKRNDHNKCHGELGTY